MVLNHRIGPFIVLLALGAGLSGCGKDNPTAPTAPPANPSRLVWNAGVTITKFEVLADGDEIAGAGEFEFDVATGVRKDSGNTIVYYLMAEKKWDRTLSTGESASLDWATGIPGPLFPNLKDYTGDALRIYVQFLCTEWDTDILGNQVPDPDMNHRSAVPIEALNPGDRISNYVTMGTDRCKVRLHYLMSADTIRVQS